MFFLVATIISVLVLCSTTDVRDKDNKTPLHWACEGGSIDVVQYLVEERKMDVDLYCYNNSDDFAPPTFLNCPKRPP